MCLASVHKVTQRENLLEEVALIRPEGKKLFLRTLFGEERVLKARIKEIDFANSTVLIEEVE
jgi:predicted RNA-binding protein